MSNVLLWLVTVEALGLATWPLLARLFPAFPDRGYGLAKAAGLLLVGFLNWWCGSIASLGNYPALMWLFLLLVLACGIWLQRAHLDPRTALPRDVLVSALICEALFLLAFAGWTLVRLQNPNIYQTEQPMDFMLLQVSGMTHSFPPPDAWLSGHTVNYYYLGYALFAGLGRMATVDSRYGYSLSNITVFALGCAGAYSIALAMLRSRVWALGGPLALMLVGDYDGFAQTLKQIQNGTFTGRSMDLICSTRIIGGCNDYRTITEFPAFSLIWNDLHPHVMAIPFALLAIAVAASALLDEHPDRRRASVALRYGGAALIVGALYPINSWDFPTYLVLILGCLLLAEARRGPLDWVRAGAIAGIVPLSLLLFAPYYLTVHFTGQGIGFQATPTDSAEFFVVIGVVLVPAMVLALWRACLRVLVPDPDDQPDRTVEWAQDLPTGWGYFLVGAAILLLAVLPARTDVALILIASCAGFGLLEGLRREPPAMLFALALTALVSLLLLFGDYVYLRDIFDGGPNYRMNTVFKLYYQSWLLLSFAASYAIYALWQSLRRAWLLPRILFGVLTLALVLPALAYLPLGIPSQSAPLAGSGTLDGLQYLSSADPDEYAALIWIRDNTPADAVIAEAAGTDAPTSYCGEYWVCGPLQSYDKVSALTGRPTIVGWPGSHESLWRSANTNPAAASMLQSRERAVHVLFTTTDSNAALSLLRGYSVSYIYVGPVETATYVEGLHLPASVLTKFADMAGFQIAYHNASVTIYAVPPG